MKKFNVTGTCIPNMHYMVDITGKLEQIKALVDAGEYFTINRGRQYGKTTTLSHLRRYLTDDYLPIFISFEGLGDASFKDEATFCQAFLRNINEQFEFMPSKEAEGGAWLNAEVTDFDQLNLHIRKLCKDKKIVLMVDEVDKASNNRVFLGFLSMLRKKFLAARDGMDFTFHSVILAGVYDIKTIKYNLIKAGLHTPAPTETKMFNSPWNIAIDFDVDMSFNPEEISTMLTGYENDHHTGMVIHAIAEEIHNFTSGYPFMVSRICQHIDTKLNKDWSIAGVQEAVKILLDESNTLFDDMANNLENNEDLANLVYDVLILGYSFTFESINSTIAMGARYGYLVRTEQRKVKISNQVFEIKMSNYFIAKEEHKWRGARTLERDIVENGRFNMQLCLEKFAEHYAEMHNEKDEKFLERHGRLLFLTYLRPLINGTGFYHFESELSDARRMDLVVDYGVDQFIIELKLWDGSAKQEKAYDQLVGYLNKKGADKGYLLTFDFRKQKTEKKGWVNVDGKEIFEVQV